MRSGNHFACGEHENVDREDFVDTAEDTPSRMLLMKTRANAEQISSGKSVSRQAIWLHERIA